MKYIFLTFCAALFAGFSAYSQENSISGKVVDTYSSEPISEAIVNIQNSDFSTVTNSAGEFTFLQKKSPRRGTSYKNFQTRL